MSPSLFAELVGAHVSTLYRWERRTTDVRMHPLHAGLLEVIQVELARRGEVGGGLWGRELSAAVLVRGGLFGLFRLLAPAFGPTSHVRNVEAGMSSTQDA